MNNKQNIVMQLLGTKQFMTGAEIRRLLYANAITINGEIPSDTYTLKTGDIVQCGKHKQFICQ